MTFYSSRFLLYCFSECVSTIVPGVLRVTLLQCFNISHFSSPTLTALRDTVDGRFVLFAVFRDSIGVDGGDSSGDGSILPFYV